MIANGRVFASTGEGAHRALITGETRLRHEEVRAELSERDEAQLTPALCRPGRSFVPDVYLSST